MNPNWKSPLQPDIPATNSASEKALLRKLSECSGDEERAELLWQLVNFYLYEAKLQDLAIEVLNLMIQESVSGERTAFCWAALGQIAEDAENWELACAHYLKGLAIAPSDSTTAYFLNNNAGHCFNKLGGGALLPSSDRD